LSVSGKKVLFDASQVPGFEEKKRGHMRSIRLILIQGMIGTPLVFTLVWVMLEVVTYSGIDPLFLGAVFAVLILLDELLMFSLVRPMLLRAWKYPARITEIGVEFGGRSIPFSDIGGLTRHESYLTIDIAGKDAHFPIMDAQMIDADGFVKAFKQQAPGIACKDAR
jgi:hypothetical protein